MAITSSEPGYSDREARRQARDSTIKLQRASERRHRLQHLIELDERHLIDLDVQAEFGALTFGVKPDRRY
jgi:hypothetical protein